MRRSAISAIAVLIAGLLGAGCQNEGGPTVSKGSKSDFAPKPAEAATAKESGGAGPAEPSPDRFRDYVSPKRQPQELTLAAHPVTVAPVIDGRGDDAVWKNAPAITTLDYSSQRPITLRSVVASDHVFFLVTFPKDAPAETHKTWTWDRKEQIYREGPDREDVFLFKWSMSGNNVRLELRDPEPHRGDIWFWKAHRSNPSGYADDKMQTVTTTPGRDARKMTSALYFRRMADAGRAPWDEKFFTDIRAKGAWANGQWTIELGRKLRTGHDDDVAFAPGGTYLFGVSCYAIAYDTPHREWSQALYRTGDVFDRLLLTIPEKASAR